MNGLGGFSGFDILAKVGADDAQFNSTLTSTEAKAKKTSNSIKLIKVITEKEYRAGLNVEHSNPYLANAH